MGGAKGILDGFLPVMLSGGYVADNRSNFVEHYTGLDDIPDEYRISKVHARDEKEEPHSILAAIKQFITPTSANACSTLFKSA